MKYGPGKHTHPQKVYKRMAQTQKVKQHPWRKPFYFTTQNTSYVPKV